MNIRKNWAQLALFVLVTVLLAVGSSVAISSTVFAHYGPAGPRGPAAYTFDRSGYAIGVRCSDNPLRMKQVAGCSRISYNK